MKENKPWKPLLAIPIKILIDVVVFALLLLFDTKFIYTQTEGMGHAAPGFATLSLMVIIPLTVIVIIVSVIMTIVRYSKKKKEDALKESQNEICEENQPQQISQDQV